MDNKFISFDYEIVKELQEICKNPYNCCNDPFKEMIIIPDNKIILDCCNIILPKNNFMEKVRSKING